MNKQAFAAGMTFGRWTVLSSFMRDSGSRLRILCRCKCGAVRYVDAYHLQTGASKSCGCIKRELASRFLDLSGKRFGRLLALHPIKQNVRDGIYYDCLCDCGNRCVVAAGHLRTMHTQSCGCLRSETVSLTAKRKTVHGESSSVLYGKWASMKQRCYNPQHPKYPLYGGRGIGVCPEWRKSFTAFHKWSMESGYLDGLTLDRIDNNKGYTPENCRWATYSEQNANRRPYRRRHRRTEGYGE